MDGLSINVFLTGFLLLVAKLSYSELSTSRRESRNSLEAIQHQEKNDHQRHLKNISLAGKSFNNSSKLRTLHNVAHHDQVSVSGHHGRTSSWESIFLKSPSTIQYEKTQLGETNAADTRLSKERLNQNTTEAFIDNKTTDHKKKNKLGQRNHGKTHSGKSQHGLNKLSKKQQIPSFLLARTNKFMSSNNLQGDPHHSHNSFLSPIHKYISTNGMEHRYIGTPIHRYLSKPINIEDITGNHMGNSKPIKALDNFQLEDTGGKPFIGNSISSRKNNYLADLDGVNQAGNQNVEQQSMELTHEPSNKDVMEPLNDFVGNPQAEHSEGTSPLELGKHFNDMPMGGYQVNRFVSPFSGFFHGPKLFFPGHGVPRQHHLVLINKPMHHTIRVPVPVPVQGPPKIIVINRPVPMPPKRIPVPVMIPSPPRIMVVHHHHLVNGPCEENPCRNAGTCSASGSDFHCVCPLGYKGDRCEVQSKCVPNPCKNFGKCTEFVNDYECTCHAGFHGKDCDVESKCDPSPCRNGGICTETRETYICSCKQGFMGKNCEQESKCHPVNPCQNNGICKEDLSGYKCLCLDNFSGMNCEVGSGNVCDRTPCLNSGTCITDPSDSSRYTCSCSSGFNGHMCQGPNLDRGCANCPIDGQCVQGICMTDINPSHNVFFSHSPCERTNPCLFGGTCVPTRYSYHCVCMDNRSGQHCETASMPCDHCSKYASCEEEKCVCNPGYTGNGLQCKKVKSNCHPNPCENGGTCEEEINPETKEVEWYCECVKGYSGKKCTVHDPCSGFICHNGGTCESGNGQPQCKCMPPYTGATCELDNVCLISGGKPRVVCQNGGTCEFSNGEAKCICTPEYEGDNCNKNKCDKCDPNAKCELGVCICKTFYIGDGITCREDPRGKAPTPSLPNYCQPDPCTNGATCIDGKTTFYCVCTGDYYGRTCSERRTVKIVYKERDNFQYNLCHPNPCLHGGICKEVSSSDFECICANPRYKGRFCDVDMCSECDVHARCVHGKCICREGYEGDGYSCARVVEKCGECPRYAQCESSVCVCRPGYTWSHEIPTSKKSCIPSAGESRSGRLRLANSGALKKHITAKPRKTQEWSEDIIVTEYQSLGCWADTTNWKDPRSRTLMSLEGLDPRLSDDYHARKQPISKCAEIARGLGYKVFAIQNGGQCFSGRDAINFKRYGPSVKCRNGVGGTLSNDVYTL